MLKCSSIFCLLAGVFIQSARAYLPPSTLPSSPFRRMQQLSPIPICLGMKPDKNEDFFYVPETRILAGDICILLMACQLLGLADVLNQPEFWSNGGFIQPIGLGPPDPVTGESTLVKLVQRDSIMSISWVLAALKNNGYDYAAIKDNRSAVKSTLLVFLDYCALLGLYTLGMAYWMKEGRGIGDVVEFLRQAWFTVLMMGGFRLTYSQFNR